MSLKKLYSKIDLQWVAFGLILVFFVLFSLYFALKTNRGISPDENYHYHVSLFFSETFSLPENSSETFRYGEISRMPFLYFWINARFINANFLEIPILTLLRILSIFYALGTLFFTYLLSKEFIKNKWFQLLPAFLLSNTLMFVFISGSISYDNLLNLFAIGSIYFLIKTFKHHRVKWFIWWGIFATLGLLTKNSMLPLFLIEVALLGYYLFKNKSLDLRQIIDFRELLFPKIFLFATVLLTSFFFGYNIFKYRSLIPSCDSILTVEECMRNGVYSRNIGLDNIDVFSPEGLIFIIKERLSPYEYFTRWLLSMNDRVYGIMGHRSLIMPNWIASAYVFFILFILGVIIRKFKRSEKNITRLLLICTSYAFVLFAFNYRRYLTTGIYNLALQGRYLFPILPALYVIYIIFIEKIENKLIRNLIVATMIIMFILGCLPFFVVRYPASWFG